MSDSFWNALFTQANTLSSKPVGSVFNQEYDFYHDAVIRHAESSQALIFIEESGFVQTWTYKKFHRAVNFQVKEWIKQSVQPGRLAVIMMPVGVRYFIALMTALRLGLKICYLPPATSFLSDNHLLSIVDEIHPDFVITQPEYARMVKERTPTLVVGDLGEDDLNHAPASFRYSKGEVVQLTLALYRQQPYAIVPLDAHTMYLHALRDGLMTLNLKPGVSHGSLHSCPLRFEPCATLMTLLSGATLAHVNEEELTKDPLVLKNEKINVLEISALLQKIWAAHPGAPIKQLKGFYKTPLHHHPRSWRSFVELNKLEEIPASHLLMDNSLGGVVFSSPPTTRDLDYYLTPSLGTPWYLQELNGSGDVSLQGFGLYHLQTSVDENNEITSNLIVSQIEKNCLIHSTVLPSRAGVTIPMEKIEETVAELSFVEYCLLYTVPKMGEIAHHQIVLLVFVAPLKNEIQKMESEWTAQLKQQIVDQVGAAFSPDRIEYYPLVPKMKEGEIDRDWCREQYHRGLLTKKKNHEIYKVLSGLKKLMLEHLE